MLESHPLGLMSLFVGLFHVLRAIQEERLRKEVEEEALLRMQVEEEFNDMLDGELNHRMLTRAESFNQGTV